MWLVLCPSSDVAGRWAFEGLRARGLAPIELVTSESLAYARWDHRVDRPAPVSRSSCRTAAPFVTMTFAACSIVWRSCPEKR